MRRRDFLKAAAVWPLVARAYGQNHMPQVGVLLPNSEEVEKQQGVGEALVRGMSDLGYVDGKNVVFVFRYGDGKAERLPALARELADSHADVLVTSGEGFPALASATTKIPIVNPTSGDLVAQGFASSLAHPGKNVTGIEIFFGEVLGKRLGMLSEIIPSLRRAGLLVMRGQLYDLVSSELAPVAKAANVELQPIVVGNGDYEGAFAAAGASIQGLICTESARFFGDSKLIAELANARRWPTIGPPEFAHVGVMVGYGIDLHGLWRQSASFVDKILKGADPGDLPIERASRFRSVVNLKTAGALGLDVPPEVLAAADEVIE